MPHKPSYYLLCAQLCFFIFLIPCILLLPQIFHEDLGISNYGVNRLTILPFSLGFLSCTYFIFQAAEAAKKHSRLRHSLQSVAVLTLALLLVPDVSNTTIRMTHVAIGLSLFTVELGVAGWLVYQARTNWLHSLLLIIQIVACASAFLSLENKLPWEAQSQLLFQLMFTTICILTTKEFERGNKKRSL